MRSQRVRVLCLEKDVPLWRGLRVVALEREVHIVLAGDPNTTIY